VQQYYEAAADEPAELTRIVGVLSATIPPKDVFS
jgi:hypothetical protein